MIFTRYLYLKDEVEISLTTAILEKKEESVFWAYELYHSGYKHETFALLWKIYYYFFSTLNPCFESYFLKKHKEWLQENKDVYVAVIVKNLMIRPFNLDVFFLHKINTHLELEDSEENAPIEKLLNTPSKYVEIAALIQKNDVGAMANTIFTHFDVDKTRKNAFLKQVKFLEGRVDAHIILVSRMMTLYTMTSHKKGRSFYVIVEPEEVVMYETIMCIHGVYKPYQILQMACLYSIDQYNYLSLFETDRTKYKNPMNVYHYFWLFHASTTPIWEERLKQFHATLCPETKRVRFASDQMEEDFYDNYGYEPDEQKLETQRKNLQHIIEEKTWSQMYNKYRESGILDIGEEIVEAFEKIRLFE
jgi:hypothetical protein